MMRENRGDYLKTAAAAMSENRFDYLKTAAGGKRGGWLSCWRSSFTMSWKYTCGKSTNQVIQSVLQIRSPHFHALPLQAQAVQKIGLCIS